jgi:DNA-binding NarL/FixJ family response regulator
MKKMLTSEEKQVLEMLGLGHTCKKICEKLSISGYRLREIKKSCIEKCKARNYTHAVYLAMSRGLF